MAKSCLPLTSKSADPHDTSPECFTNINSCPDIGNNNFDYERNTTACADGTFCPNPNNQTCCFNNQGHSLISYHYDAALPTAAVALSTFYAENGYQIVTTTSSSSNILPKTSPSSPLPVFSSTSAPTSTYVGTSPPGQKSPSPLDTGTKAGIGIGAVVGTLAIAGMLLLLLRRVRRHRRDDKRHSIALGTIERTPLDPRQWEKPELIGEDARKEMGAEERRKAELPGEEARTEIGAEERRRAELPRTEARMEMGAADLREMLVNELPA